MLVSLGKRNTLGGRHASVLALIQRAFSTDGSSSSSTTGIKSHRRAPLTGPLSVQKGGRGHISGIVATVFGATGFLGRYVVSDLGYVGSQVVVPYRGDGENTRHLKLAGDLGQVVPIPVDLWDDEALRRSVARSNVVVNLVGSQFETKNYSFHDANVKTTHRIAKFAAEAGVERFIQMSTLSADINSHSRWIATKTEGEEVARDFFPNATILRLGHVFGSEDRFLNTIADMLRAPIFPLVNDGKQKLQPVAVRDVAAAVMQAIILPEAQGQTYHIGGDKVVTYKQVVDLVSEMVFRSDNSVSLPKPTAELIGKVSDSLLFLSTRRRRFTEELAKQMSVDCIVPEGKDILTAKDLCVELTEFEVSAAGQMVGRRGVRGEIGLWPQPGLPYLESGASITQSR